MDKPISVGDLVQVVRPTKCCGRIEWLGLTFVVDWVDELEGACNYCDFKGPDEMGAGKTVDNGDGFSMTMLKRIPPLSELEGEKRAEEITT